MRTHPSMIWWMVAVALQMALHGRALAADAAVAGPEISVTVRGVAARTVEVGEPLFVAVRVNTRDDAAKINLAPAQGSWADAISVEVVSGAGDRTVATAKLAVPPESPAIVLEADQAATGLWWVSAGVMGPLPAGDYSVRAKLSVRDGSGWKGEALSEPAELRIVALVKDDPARITQRALAHAHAAVLEGSPRKAAELLDEVLARDPDNILILEMRAALSLSAGNPGAAWVCINHARTLAGRRSEHPSVELHQLARQIEAVMAKDSGESPAEAWTHPPQAVIEAIRTRTATEQVPRK